MNVKELQKRAYNNEQRIIELRRIIHQHPELAFEEVQTARLVCEELERLGIEVHSNYADTTAVIGVLKGEKPGPTRALRADMDALPVQEQTGLPFASNIPGKMHACGHDAHVSILLGAAHILAQLRSELSGNIVFVFQPAEEGKGGGRVLTEYGLLEDFGIEAIFGHHVWPGLKEGHYFGTRPGVLTSNSDTVIARIYGKGAHGARPNQGLDPVVISSHYVLACQELISREISPGEPVVLTYGRLHAGDSYNVIPEEAELTGTVRTQSSETRDFIERRLGEILHGITATFRSTGKLEYIRRYPSIVNHDALTSQVFTWAEAFWGNDHIENVPHPSMIGEDFAFYAQKIPACFGFLGVKSQYDLHNPHFAVEESSLAPAAAWTAWIALNSFQLSDRL